MVDDDEGLQAAAVVAQLDHAHAVSLARAVARATACAALWLAVLSRGRECLLEVGPEVLDVLAADADAQQVVGNDGAFGRVAGAPLERRLDAPEAGGMGAEGEGLDERIGAGGAPANAEGEHEAVTAEVVAA